MCHIGRRSARGACVFFHRPSVQASAFLIVLNVGTDEIGHVAVILFLFLFKEGVIVVAADILAQIDVVAGDFLLDSSGIRLFQRHHINLGRAGSDFIVVLHLRRFRHTTRQLLHLEVRAAFGAGDRVTIEIVEFRAAAEALPFHAEFWLGHV